MQHSDDRALLPSCNVVALIAILYGPLPTLVLAAILHRYVVNGVKVSIVRIGAVDISCNVWPVSVAYISTI